MNRKLLSIGIVISVAVLVAGVGGVSQTARAASNGTISGTVYFDTNTNGQRDPGERPASGRTVSLVEYTNGESNPQTLSESGPDGKYRFDGLSLTSTYSVGVEIDSQTVCVMNGPQDVLPGTAWTGRDLGVLENGKTTLSGSLVNDLNANGVRDPGEPGLAGWMVEAGATDKDGLVSCGATATTDADGRFSMENLPPLEFELGPNQPLPPEPSAVIPTFPTAPVTSYPDARVLNWTVDLAGAGQEVQTGAGFHFLKGSGSIAGLVYADSNLDGAREENEPLIDCDTIQFFLQAYWHAPAGTFPVYLSGQVVPKTTCQDGRFEIDGLEAGTYTIGMPWCGLPGAPEGQLQGPSEQTASVAEGQRVEGVDLALCSDPRQGMPVPVPPPISTAPPAPASVITSPNTGSGPSPATSEPLPAALALAFVGAGALALTVRAVRRRSCAQGGKR